MFEAIEPLPHCPTCGAIARPNILMFGDNSKIGDLGRAVAKLLDAPHKKGIYARRGRAAAGNIVPTSTGAAVAVGKVLPNLNGKLDGIASRVPVITGSCVDLVVELKKTVTVEEINAAVKARANESLGYTEDPIVSSDTIGMQYGTLFDANMTKVMTVDGKQMVKILTWYDNEMSYTSQMVRTIAFLADGLKD